jgi:NADH-quinone oxidoreductase subunit E
MVNEKYVEVINAHKNESFLDALRALQAVDGYVTSEAIEVLAAEFGRSPASIYSSASFYAMIRFTPPAEVLIQICHNAPCHVAGTAEVVSALEDALNIRMGETTPDGKFQLEYGECIGQCQGSPCLLVNGVLHRQMNAQAARKLVAKEGLNV